MSLDSALHGRLALSALLSSSTGGLALLLALCSSDEFLRLGAALAATAFLPLARLLGCAVAARSPAAAARSVRLGRQWRQVILEILSFFFTTLSCCLFAASLGESETWVMGLALAAVAQIRQPGRQGLSWCYFPQQATHRKVKAELLWMLVSSLLLTLLCFMLTWSISTGSTFGPWICTGLVVLSSVELQRILMEGATSSLAGIDGNELLEGLLQPLSCEGPGLSRWLALAALANAVVYRHQAQTLAPALGYRADIQPPPLAAQVFGLRGKAQTISMVSGFQAPDGRSFFAVYLQSGLEVLREFTIRVQCIAAASRRKGAKAFDLAQLQVLETDVLQLAPLMRMAASGLSGWICLSRDLDDMGKVQREDALSKVIYELCGGLQALQRLISLHGLVDLCSDTVRCAQSCYQEAQHSLYQLLITFERCGLQQVVLPQQYKRMLEDVMRPV